jgi:hypothetical protein
MLLQNKTLHAQYPYLRSGASTLNTEAGNLRSQLGIRNASQLTRFVSGWEKRTGVPTGYGAGNALLAPIKGGGMGLSTSGAVGVGAVSGGIAQGKACAATIDGAGVLTPPPLSMLVQCACSILGEGVIDNASISGSISMAATLAGEGDISGALNVIAWVVSTLTGAGAVDNSTQCFGTARCEATIYVSQSTASTQQLAAAVWAALAADFTEAGSMGQAMGAAGSAGDPWITELPGSYTGDQAGNIMGQQLLTVAKFLGLK